MKAEILVPTVTYGNIRFFLEDEPENIIAEARRLNALWTGGDGLSDKEFCTALDRYVGGEGMEAQMYEKMSLEQQLYIQTLKRCLKRIKYKNERV